MCNHHKLKIYKAISLEYKILNNIIIFNITDANFQIDDFIVIYKSYDEYNSMFLKLVAKVSSIEQNNISCQNFVFFEDCYLSIPEIIKSAIDKCEVGHNRRYVDVFSEMATKLFFFFQEKIVYCNTNIILQIDKDMKSKEFLKNCILKICIDYKRISGKNISDSDSNSDNDDAPVKKKRRQEKIKVKN